MNNEHDQYQSLTYDDYLFGDRQDTHNTDTTHTFSDDFLTLPEYPGDSFSNPDNFISTHGPDISAQMNNSFMAEYKAIADQIEHQSVINNENRFVNRQGRLDEDRIDKCPDGFLTLPEYPGDSFSNPDDILTLPEYPGNSFSNPDDFLTLPEYPGDSFSKPDDFISDTMPYTDEERMEKFLDKFKDAPVDIIRRFYNDFTRITGTFIDRSKASQTIFRLTREIHAPGHDILRRAGNLRASSPLKFAIMLYEIYFLTGHYGEGADMIPMFFGSPFEIGTFGDTVSCWVDANSYICTEPLRISLLVLCLTCSIECSKRPRTNSECRQYQSLLNDDDPFRNRQERHNTDRTHTFPDGFLILPEYPGDSLSDSDDLISNPGPDMATQMNMGELEDLDDNPFSAQDKRRRIINQHDPFDDPEGKGNDIEALLLMIPNYLRNDGGILNQLGIDNHLRPDRVEERQILGIPLGNIDTNKQRRIFPMDLATHYEPIRPSTFPMLREEKTRLLRVTNRESFHDLAGCRIRLRNSPVTSMWLQLPIYEAMRFLRVESAPLPILYDPPRLITNNIFQRKLRRLSPTNTYLFDPPLITDQFVYALRGFKAATGAGLKQFYADFTLLTGAYIERTKGLHENFRYSRALQLPGYRTQRKVRDFQQSSPVKIALMLYEIYFYRGHFGEDEDIIPMFFGSPFQATVIKAENFQFEMSENELFVIHAASRYLDKYGFLLGRREFVYLYRTVNDFITRLEQRYEEMQPILGPLGMDNDAMRQFFYHNPLFMYFLEFYFGVERGIDLVPQIREDNDLM
ncbi:hypothetical protein SNEBB_009401 [Seison nebaliae]|nr:hypothetical protein SNEBB_009401 [Seison nebaliae]